MVILQHIYNKFADNGTEAFNTFNLNTDKDNTQTGL